MSTSTNKALVRTFVDTLFTRGDLQAIDHMLAPAFVNHDPMPGFGTDREALRQSAVIFRSRGELVGQVFMRHCLPAID